MRIGSRVAFTKLLLLERGNLYLRYILPYNLYPRPQVNVQHNTILVKKPSLWLFSLLVIFSLLQFIASLFSFMLSFHEVFLIACFSYFYHQTSYFTFLNALIDRETINLTSTPYGFDPYLPSYLATLCTCDITIEGRKVPINYPQDCPP